MTQSLAESLKSEIKGATPLPAPSATKRYTLQTAIKKDLNLYIGCRRTHTCRRNCFVAYGEAEGIVGEASEGVRASAGGHAVKGEAAVANIGWSQRRISGTI
eukprot:CAMPEP_0202909886 /NCGR_PEP_ID=MMETSP1392-20130828/50536_1 /ASSEMBLY_ACC=CAM_ASM_000868 /TAXON_ID=225041 /ORGANISM="Chlamydomonas chlamydogama, Strain SAG 11-48b" /LENGTH=101 /DNA_ID=CAMNT_0049599779 /DNA_START=160 /DNA_END=463 /DNA_ORIENTATION=+